MTTNDENNDGPKFTGAHCRENDEQEVLTGTNERYTGGDAPGLFRNFLLVAAVNGAKIGYDGNGDVWAVVDESPGAGVEGYEPEPCVECCGAQCLRCGGEGWYCGPFLPEITFSEGDSCIWAACGVAIPGRDWLEWKPCPEFDGEKGSVYFILTLAAPMLVYNPLKGWAVDGPNTSDLVWYPIPTIPADRIEDQARALTPVAA